MNNDQSQPPKQSFWSKIFGGSKKQDTNNDAGVGAAADPVASSPVEDQISSIPPSPISDTIAPSSPVDTASVSSPVADISPAVEQDIDASIASSTADQGSNTIGETVDSTASGFSGSSFDSPVVEAAPEVPQPPADPMVTPVQTAPTDPTVTAESTEINPSGSIADSQPDENVLPPDSPSSPPPVA